MYTYIVTQFIQILKTSWYCIDVYGYGYVMSLGMDGQGE